MGWRYGLQVSVLRFSESKSKSGVGGWLLMQPDWLTGWLTD